MLRLTHTLAVPALISSDDINILTFLSMLELADTEKSSIVSLDSPITIGSSNLAVGVGTKITQVITTYS